MEVIDHEYDVILTAFADSNQSPYQKWVEKYFTNPFTRVINIPGSDGPSYRSKIQSWAKTGDLFKKALDEHSVTRDVKKINRRALVTFSVGWSAGEEILKIKKERDRLDAYLLLDGCHTKDLTCWTEYANRAASLKAFMVMAHSTIKPPTFISTKETNSKVFRDSSEWLQEKKELSFIETDIPNFVRSVILEKPITISLAGNTAHTYIAKTWKEDPLRHCENIGNLTRLEYEGNDRPDHMYIAWHVSERLFKWLGEEWNK